MKKKREAEEKPTRKHGKVDPVRVQIKISALMPKRGPKPEVTNHLLNEVAQNWAQTGKVPKGFRIDAVEWLNPKRKNAALAVTKSAKTASGIEHARQTLHLRRLLPRMQISFMGSGRGRAGKR